MIWRKYPVQDISNQYAARVKPGAHSLIIPLGSNADLTVDLSGFAFAEAQPSALKLIDISGAKWEIELEK